MQRRACFSDKVLSWFERYGRHALPWQKNPTPYRVWISEIMLQQTQVVTVLAYYERFMARFPTIEQLANAPLDDVLHLWSGLGYYTRARNLHRCAQLVWEQYQGRWPMDVAIVSTFPGIGRSTAGAIISLSHNHFAPILDGNVKRVLARFFAIEGWQGNAKIQAILWEKAEALTPKTQARDYNQAMMDLGATVCTRTKPRCGECPVQADCQAFQKNAISHYPAKKPKTIVPVIHKQFLLLMTPDNKHVWLYRRPPSGIWGGLWSLPELAMEENIEHWLAANYFSALSIQPAKKPIKHTFSHFILYLHPVYVIMQHQDTTSLCRGRLPASARIEEPKEGDFYALDRPWPGGVAAPILKLLATLIP